MERSGSHFGAPAVAPQRRAGAPGGENLAMVLQRAVRLFPDNEAVIEGDTRWSYSELGQRVAGFDTSLSELGLEQGDVVGVLSLNSASYLVAWLAIPRSGRLLNALNYRLAPAELEFIVGDSEVRAVLVDDEFLDVGRQLAGSCGTVEHLVYMGAGEAPEGCLSMEEMMGTEPAPAVFPAPEEPVGIFYTGGTTGTPKGAMLSHRNLIANAKHVIIERGYKTGHTYLHAGPMFHLSDGGSTLSVTWVGARHVILPKFTPEAWLDAVEGERVTHSVLVPTMINMLLNDPATGARDTSSLEAVNYGSSPMPSQLLREGMEAFPCNWLQFYGSTEVAPIATCLNAEDHRRGVEGEEPYVGRLRSAGRQVVGVEVSVRREDGSVADPFETGEVYVRGPNVMLGYWNRPEETAAVLDDDGWYHTGDAGYFDEDAYLYIADRVKDMIISGGENVYSTEVENAIFRHPAVLECAVFAVPDERWGERVHAAVVLRAEAELSEVEIVEHCRQFIAGYKLPRSVDFHDEPLPKSGAGKILKRELRKPYWGDRDRAVS